MSFDLAKTNLTKSSEAGYELQLKLPELNQPLDAYIKIRGGNSSTVMAFEKKKYNEEQMKEQVRKRKNKPEEVVTFEELEEKMIESAVVRTIGWHGIEENGAEVHFTPDNARRIYAEHPWIRNQVITESELVSNFL